jgi:uncharacterized protein (DUF885 family)
MAKKKMTIEVLAIMVNKGFGGVNQRLDELEKKTEKRFTELTEALTKFIRSTNDNFRHVNARLDRVRDDISDVPAMREELRHFRTRLERIERKV